MFCLRCNTPITSSQQQTNRGLCDACYRAVVGNQQAPTPPPAPGPIYIAPPTKKPSRYHRSLAVAIIFAVILFWVESPLWLPLLASPKREKQSAIQSNQMAGPLASSPTASTSSEESISYTTPHEFMKWFNANPVSAQDWSQDKTFVITGKVYDTGNDMMGSNDACIVFDCHSGNQFLNTHMTVWFDSDFRHQISSLSDGQTVSVKCTFSEQEFMGDFKMKGSGISN